MKPLYEDEFWNASVQWTRPMVYDHAVSNGSEYDSLSSFYMILGRYSNQPAKIMYIGMTFSQSVKTRLCQPDHQRRYAAFKGAHKHHWFQVSHGLLTINNGNFTEKRVKDIEQLLIYTYTKDSAHVKNLKSIYSHGVTGSYLVRNTGYRSSLPRKLSYGLFLTK